MSEFTGMFCALSLSLTASVDYSWQKDFEIRAFAHGGGKGWANVSATTNALQSSSPQDVVQATRPPDFAIKLCCPEDVDRIHVIPVEQFLCGCEGAR